MDAKVREWYEDSLQRQCQIMHDCGTAVNSDAFLNAAKLAEAIEEILNADPDADEDESADEQDEPETEGRSLTVIYSELMELRHSFRYSPDQPRESDGKFGDGEAVHTQDAKEHEAKADQKQQEATKEKEPTAKERKQAQAQAHREAAAAHRQAAAAAKEVKKAEQAAERQKDRESRERVAMAKARYKLYVEVAKLLTKFAMTLAAGAFAESILKKKKS